MVNVFIISCLLFLVSYFVSFFFWICGHHGCFPFYVGVNLFLGNGCLSLAVEVLAVFTLLFSVMSSKWNTFPAVFWKLKMSHRGDLGLQIWSYQGSYIRDINDVLQYNQLTWIGNNWLSHVVVHDGKSGCGDNWPMF